VEEAKRDALARAKARLDALRLHPRPVSLRGVHIWIVPGLFRLPWFRRFDGYAAHWTILLRSRAFLEDDSLVAHELCHVWQMQHRPLRMPLSYLLLGYDENPYEHEARRAGARRVLVFLHGTAIMHAAAEGVSRVERVRQVRGREESVRRFDEYVPTPCAVERVRSWAGAGWEIAYLSSHRLAADVAADERVLNVHGFPPGPVLYRAPDQTYGEVATAFVPDLVVEDDCESIGGEAEMVFPQLPPELRSRADSLVVPEFAGLCDLPASLGALN
jgi:hypothetical protein